LSKSASRVADLSAGVGGTPVSPVAVRYGDRTHRVLIKRERCNPTGSVKDRTAVGLLRAMDRTERLRPGTVVVESTSGNLGIALARQLAVLDCALIAVIDPKTPDATRVALSDAGVQLHCVTEPDDFGGYLLTRLRTVAQLCRANPEYRWTNQYDNPANPLIHRETTGPEIVAQGGAALDAVYVAVSTGGTLAGISAYVRSVPRPEPIRLVAVDALFSVATGPPRVGRRLVPGIGASRPSSFLHPGSYDYSVSVSDADAVAMCRMFTEDTGVRLGGSSGCVISACVEDLAGTQPPARAMCVCADDGASYQDTVYDDGWLVKVDLLDDVSSAVDRLRNAGLDFRLD
jgi:cysteine synthase